MVNQHAKWLESAKAGVYWRMPVPSLNLLMTSNGVAPGSQRFHASGPGFLDVVTQERGRGRIYLPPDANCLLSVARSLSAQHQLCERHRGGQAASLQYLNMDAALKHCSAGVTFWVGSTWRAIDVVECDRD